MNAVWMFLAGALLGLVVGASVGVVIAGLLLQSDDAPDESP